MKRLILSGILATLYICAQAAVTFTYPNGNNRAVIATDAVAATGLNGGVQVAPTVAGLRISVSSSSPNNVNWSRFSMLGAAYAEQINASGSDAASSWIDSPTGDMGYVVEADGVTTYFWLVDYSKHPFSVFELTLADEQDCGMTHLVCDATGDEISYYSITGRRYTLSRDIKLSYYTLSWDNESQSYATETVGRTLEYLSPAIYTPAPLCTTSYTIAGDRFMKAWGAEENYTSVDFAPHSVDAHTEALSDTRESDNEVSTGQGGDFGGSAPCTITFKADVTEGAIFHEWQFSNQSDFSNITFRASELEFTYTFIEQGNTYVRLYCANDDASCDYYGQTYTISIGESMLKCPNAFSPFNRDGVNDEWKVSYSSIIEYECHIFNRSGHKIISMNDPAQGWDGTYGGKDVPAGAYYYVIKALGADGRKYNLSGDINIVDYK